MNFSTIVYTVKYEGDSIIGLYMDLAVYRKILGRGLREVTVCVSSIGFGTTNPGSRVEHEGILLIGDVDYYKFLSLDIMIGCGIKLK